MEDSLEVKLKLTKKQLEDLCLYMGEQSEVHTKFIIELLNLKLNSEEVDDAVYSLYCQLSDVIGIE